MAVEVVVAMAVPRWTLCGRAPVEVPVGGGMFTCGGYGGIAAVVVVVAVAVAFGGGGILLPLLLPALLVEPGGKGTAPG